MAISHSLLLTVFPVGQVERRDEDDACISQEKRAEGFTLIELMIVIAIIGILAAIAIPQFVAYRARGYSAAANSAVRNAFTASQAFFSDSPGGTVANDVALSDYGYRIDPNVPLTVGTGTINSIQMSATHVSRGSTFTVDYTGGITKS